MAIHPGRFSAEIEGDFVVLLIGMRFNKPWLVHRWLPVARAMTDMLRWLGKHPEAGLLGYHQYPGRTTLMVQYWRDFESLNRFARDGSMPHLGPWRKFNKAVRDSGDVGIYHETYQVRAGEYEAIYGNMPVFGLAAASAHVPIAKRGQSAAGRLGLLDEPLDEVY
ncbi:MAG TPA: DUF4188 domain-containing protein [Frankiaceae bacterium]|jgi:hypothetical protein|nr:DUF4188 domain-containing protein [Frankiaceae bacterium]